MKDLSIVIPCLNEERTIGICIDKCIDAFSKLDIDGEVIVSDNGSTDNSVNIAKQHGATVVSCHNKGYGYALRFGFKNASGKWILMGDADNTYDFSEIPLFYNEIDNDVDMIIGSRIKGYIEKDSMPFLHRYIGTPFLTFLINLLYKTNITDSQCGMRLLKKESLDKINFTTTGMEFASELLVEFAKHKYKIKEVKISLHKGLDSRISHLNPWRDGLRHLFYIIKSINII